MRLFSQTGTPLWYIFVSLGLLTKGFQSKTLPENNTLITQPALTEKDETLLHGRGEVVAEIVQNCLAERLTVITSEPGLGVTSLLRAGVVPALKREGFLVVLFSDWQGRSFAANLKEAIAAAVRESADPQFVPFAGEGESLDKLLVRVRAGNRIAILLDQFEDYLRRHTNTVTSDAFDAELAHAIAARKGVFVIGLHEHATLALGRMDSLIPNLLGYQIRLAPLSPEDARAAVVSTARGMQMEIEPAALDALVNAPTVIREAEKVHPFFLKLATRLLVEAEARLNSPVLRVSTIESSGGVDRVVLESFDAPIAQLGAAKSGKASLELLFHSCGILISPEGERLAVTEKRLTAAAGKLHRLVPAVLKQLIELGILRSVETPEAVRYEIAHECYAPILRDWWERRESAIVARRRAAFRIISITGALSAILLMYVIYIFFGQK